MGCGAGCHIPGDWEQAQEEPRGDYHRPVPCAVHPATLPHQHHVLGRQVGIAYEGDLLLMLLITLLYTVCDEVLVFKKRNPAI